LQSIKKFIVGCLNQLLWVNSILESGKCAVTIEDLEEEFDYKTPTMLGDSWTLDKVTKKGVFFRGDEPFLDSRVIINSENIIVIALALSTVLEKYNKHTAANDSSLFISKELENNCLNVLKELEQPVLDIDGKFLNEHGMKGAVVIWYDKCKFLGFTSKATRNRDEIAIVIMELIPNLKIEGSLFDKSGKAKKYKNEIELKLSQISRK